MIDQKSDRHSIQKNILKDIRLRYVIAVLLIAFFSILTLFINYSLHQRMEQDFETINISGRQRMLTQRIALLSDRNKTEELLVTIQEFNEALTYLKNTRFVQIKYPDVYNAYNGKDGIEAVARSFTNYSSKTDDESKLQLFRLSQELLKKFDNVTLIVQNISESEFMKIISLEILILLITLTLLALELIFIFKPMAKRVETGFFQLNKIEDQSMASARLVMIGEVTASIGHEIRNPLTVILAHLDTMDRRKENENPEQANQIKIATIKKNVEKIVNIVSALSIHARESSSDPMEPTNLQTIIDDALELFKHRMKLESITLICNNQVNANVICQHAAISQVIGNLISNAIDSISECSNLDSKTIQLEVLQENERIYVRVMDSGPGVPSDLTDKIFESFITTKKLGKGTGLGLAISKKIMLNHGGNLYLNTKISPSCFEMSFPPDHIVKNG